MAEAKDTVVETKKDPKPEMSPLQQALQVPDAEGAKGKVITEDDLIRPVHDNTITDPLTLQEYPAGSWTEAKPSAWLDLQLVNEKIVRK